MVINLRISPVAEEFLYSIKGKRSIAAYIDYLLVKLALAEKQHAHNNDKELYDNNKYLPDQ